MMTHRSDKRDPEPSARGWQRYVQLMNLFVGLARLILDLFRH
jgi:hypothetical protein